MAGSAMTPSVLSINSAPKIGYKSDPYETRVRVARGRGFGSVCLRLGSGKGGITLKRVNAEFSEIEPDLNEDYRDPYATNGISDEDFIYGEMDDHHTYHGEDEAAGTFWELVARDFAAVGPPSGFQGLISWLFLPAVAAGLYFDVPGEYLYIGAALFTIVFCIIEMDKPSEPHNFEPQIYNMERGARDKLISDYNTMNIWEFNEKYDYTSIMDSKLQGQIYHSAITYLDTSSFLNMPDLRAKKVVTTQEKNSTRSCCCLN